jgi:hypothetical protein
MKRKMTAVPLLQQNHLPRLHKLSSPQAVEVDTAGESLLYSILLRKRAEGVLFYEPLI